MNEISCDLCMDLMPLVRDGVAGADSRAAVEAHLESCGACRELFEAGVPESSGDQALSKAMKRVQTVSAVSAWAVVLLGVVLCELVMQGSSAVFLLAVVVIRSLLRVVFSREKGKILKKTAALVGAVTLTAGILWLGNEVFGNPVTKAQAEHHIQGYLEGAYDDSDYYVAEVDYIMSSMTYEGEIRSNADETIVFYIVWRRGEVLYDTYQRDVLGIWE